MIDILEIPYSGSDTSSLPLNTMLYVPHHRVREVFPEMVETLGIFVDYEYPTNGVNVDNLYHKEFGRSFITPESKDLQFAKIMVVIKVSESSTPIIEKMIKGGETSALMSLLIPDYTSNHDVNSSTEILGDYLIGSDYSVCITFQGYDCLSYHGNKHYFVDLVRQHMIPNFTPIKFMQGLDGSRVPIYYFDDAKLTLEDYAKALNKFNLKKFNAKMDLYHSPDGKYYWDEGYTEEYTEVERSIVVVYGTQVMSVGILKGIKLDTDKNIFIKETPFGCTSKDYASMITYVLLGISGTFSTLHIERVDCESMSELCTKLSLYRAAIVSFCSYMTNTLDSMKFYYQPSADYYHWILKDLSGDKQKMYALNNKRKLEELSSTFKSIEN